jgi:hypothetical protein
MKSCMGKQVQKLSGDRIRDFNLDATVDPDA